MQAFRRLWEQVGLGQVCAIPKYELVSFFVLPNVNCSSIKMLPSCRHSVLDKAPLSFFVINNMHLAECNNSWFVWHLDRDKYCVQITHKLILHKEFSVVAPLKFSYPFCLSGQKVSITVFFSLHGYYIISENRAAPTLQSTHPNQWFS